ncbi:MAG: hypothetical protein LBL06_05100 [Treponema sp.]|nr:hypothetical protein [Treponema sp.]
MKRTIVKIGVAALLAALFLSACSDGGSEDLNKAATLSSVTLAGYALAQLPTPIPNVDWNDEEFLLSGLDAEYTAQLTVDTAAELTNAAITVSASSGAKLQYAVGIAAAKPNATAFSNTATVTLSANNYLYIRVTSEDGKTVNYYRIQVTTKSANNNLTGITFGDVSATLGTPAATYNDASLVAGAVSLTNDQITSVVVTATPSSSTATVKYAKVIGDGAPTFADSLTDSFADGNFVYVEVTAQNGTDKNIYKVEVQIGRNANLTGISIGGVNAYSFGTPSATVATATAGRFLFNAPSADNVAVTTSVADTAATVKYAKATGTATPTFGNETSFTFNDLDYLYIEATAANGTTKLYYKIQVNLQQTATITYGTPDLDKKGDDPIWANLTEYNINKVYPTDSTAAFSENPDTSGIAKALFDENGVWVYVEVTDPDVHTSVPTTDQYLYDSVEVFINENLADEENIGYANKGGQYRVGAQGEVSGDPDQATAALTEHTAWTTTAGYAVIFQAPWRFKANYPLVDGKKIGFELQINAGNGTGTRNGVMVWNNIAHTNYQNVTDYGEATLDAGGHEFTTSAETPTISGQPSSVKYDIASGSAAPTLSVTTAVADGGTLTYQWYSNTTDSTTGGTEIASATNATYIPPVTAEGTTYYYVIITNTNNSVSGDKVKTATSSIAKVEVVDYTGLELAEKIGAAASSVPVYQFTLPTGATWSDYKKMTFTVMVADETSYNHLSARAHIAGNYSASQFTNGIHTAGDWGSERILNIANGNADDIIKGILGDPGLNVWKVLEYDTSSFSGTGVPASDAAGPFLFGLGLTLNPNNLADGSKGEAVTYYIKDVALVKDNGDKLSPTTLVSPLVLPCLVNYGASST